MTNNRNGNGNAKVNKQEGELKSTRNSRKN